MAKPIDFDILFAIITARLAGVAPTGAWPSAAEHNDREVETLTWAARGKTSLEIAWILGLSNSPRMVAPQPYYQVDGLRALALLVRLNVEGDALT